MANDNSQDQQKINAILERRNKLVQDINADIEKTNDLLGEELTSLELAGKRRATHLEVTRELLDFSTLNVQQMEAELDFLEKQLQRQRDKNELSAEEAKIFKETINARKEMLSLLQAESPEHKNIQELLQKRLSAEYKSANAVEKAAQAQTKIGQSLAVNLRSMGLLVDKSTSFTSNLIRASKQAGGMKTAFRAFAEEIGGLSGFFEEFSLAMAQKMEELMAFVIKKTIDMAFAFDSATTSMQQSTTAGEKYNDMLMRSYETNKDLATTLEEEAEVFKGLYNEVSVFSELQEGTQKSLMRTSNMLQRVGVDVGTQTSLLESMTKSLRLTGPAAEQTFRDMVDLSQELNVGMGKLSKGFEKAMKSLAVHGNKAYEMFAKLAKITKQTGIETDRLVGIAEGFDTFEDAAQSVGQLNAVLGGPYLDSITMMSTTDPSERIDYLRNTLDAAGQSWDSMDYYMKKAVASSMGISDMEEASRLFGETSEEAAAAMQKEAERKKELEELTQDMIPIQANLTRIMNDFAVAIQPVATFLADAANWLKEVGINGNILLPIVVGLWGAFKMWAIWMAIANARNVTAIATNTALAVSETQVAAGQVAMATTSGPAAAGMLATGGAAGGAAAPMLAFALAAIAVGAAAWLIFQGLAAVVDSLTGLIGKLLEAPEHILTLIGLFGMMSLTVITIATVGWIAALALGAMALGFGAVALALAFIKTDDLQALSGIMIGLGNIARGNISNFFAIGAAIRQIADAVDDLNLAGAIGFSIIVDGLSKIDELNNVQENLGAVKNVLVQVKEMPDAEREGVSEILDKATALTISAGNPVATMTLSALNTLTGLVGALRGTIAPEGAAGAKTEKKQPIVLTMNDREFARAVIKVINDRYDMRKVGKG